MSPNDLLYFPITFPQHSVHQPLSQAVCPVCWLWGSLLCFLIFLVFVVSDHTATILLYFLLLFPRGILVFYPEAWLLEIVLDKNYTSSLVDNPDNWIDWKCLFLLFAKYVQAPVSSVCVVTQAPLETSQCWLLVMFHTFLQIPRIRWGLRNFWWRGPWGCFYRLKWRTRGTSPKVENDKSQRTWNIKSNLTLTFAFLDKTWVVDIWICRSVNWSVLCDSLPYLFFLRP